MIAVEGADFTGKTTLIDEIILKKKINNIEKYNFPNRSTDIGKIIDKILVENVEIPFKSLHLLFAANRAEMEPEIIHKLKAGTTIICDRYFMSGIIYTVANAPASFCLENNVNEYAILADKTLIKPDLTILLTAASEDLIDRKKTNEKFETIDFQKKIVEMFLKFIETDDCLVLDALENINNLVCKIENEIERKTKEKKNEKFFYI